MVAVYIGEPPTGALHAAGKPNIKALITPTLIKQVQDAEVNNAQIPQN